MCGVPLVAAEKLPPSHDVLLEEPSRPEYEPLPLAYPGRGRGLLVALSVAGLAAFFLPWVHVTMPDVVSYSGFELARRLGWAWGAGVAWFILVPTVLSRRSIVQMRGARVAAAFLAAIPGLTVAILLARAPSQHGAYGVPLRFTFGAGLHVTLALSVVGLVAAVLFGGRIDDIRLRRGTSEGEVVH